MEPPINEYSFAWAVEELASRWGWKRTARQLSDRLVIMTFEKVPEPEPGAGKEDSA